MGSLNFTRTGGGTCDTALSTIELRETLPCNELEGGSGGGDLPVDDSGVGAIVRIGVDSKGSTCDCRDGESKLDAELL